MSKQYIRQHKPHSIPRLLSKTAYNPTGHAPQRLPFDLLEKTFEYAGKLCDHVTHHGERCEQNGLLYMFDNNHICHNYCMGHINKWALKIFDNHNRVRKIDDEKASEIIEFKQSKGDLLTISYSIGNQRHLGVCVEYRPDAIASSIELMEPVVFNPFNSYQTYEQELILYMKDKEPAEKHKLKRNYYITINRVTNNKDFDIIVNFVNAHTDQCKVVNRPQILKITLSPFRSEEFEYEFKILFANFIQSLATVCDQFHINYITHPIVTAFGRINLWEEPQFELVDFLTYKGFQNPASIWKGTYRLLWGFTLFKTRDALKNTFQPERI